MQRTRNNVLRLLALIMLGVMCAFCMSVTTQAMAEDTTPNVYISTAQDYGFARLEGNTSKVTWSIEDSNVAQIVKTSKQYAKLAPVSVGKTVVTATSGEETLSFDIIVYAPKIEGSNSVRVGDSLELFAVGDYVDGWKVDNKSMLALESSRKIDDPDALVSDGTFNAKKPGVVDVTVLFKSGCTATKTITVKSNVQVEPCVMSSEAPFGFARLANKTDFAPVTWEAGSEGIYNIISSGKSYAKLIPQRTGDSSISAKLADGSTISGNVYIYEPYLEITDVVMRKGETREIRLEGGRIKNLFSSSKAKATPTLISKDATESVFSVTAGKVGQATVTAITKGGTRCQCNIRVIDDEREFAMFARGPYFHFLMGTGYTAFKRADAMPDQYVLADDTMDYNLPIGTEVPTGADRTPGRVHVISSPDSPLPIYGWDDNGVCYWYTDADVVFANPDSSDTFTSWRNCTEYDFTGWDFRYMECADNMFSYNQALTKLDTANWNVSNLKNAYAMFYLCDKMTTYDMANWDVSNVEDFGEMFACNYGLTDASFLENWDVSNGRWFSNMFMSTSSLRTINLNNWNMSNAISLAYMFQSSAIENFGFADWNVENVQDYRHLFQDCDAMTFLDISGWNTGNATKTDWMFYGCDELVSLNMSTFDMSKVESASSMFYGCEKLEALDVSKWNVGNLKNMKSMFEYCQALKTIDVSKWNTGSATSMESMFAYCTAMESLDVAGWDTSNVTTVYKMFYYCKNLTLDCRTFDTTSVSHVAGMNYFNTKAPNVIAPIW